MPPIPARTKIVATVGPACSSEASLEALVQAGVDVFRLNMAHGSQQQHAQVIELVRRISQRWRRPLGLLVDLAGPKIRLGELKQDPTVCIEGQRWKFVRRESGADDELTCNYERLIDELAIDDVILLADGAVSMRVRATTPDSVTCEVQAAGVISSRQGVNLPGAKLSVPALTEKDQEDARWAAEQRVDFVSLSFVRRAADLQQLRALFQAENTEPWLVAKIEKREALEDLAGIIGQADAVMVARGDLGIEIDVAEIAVAQKKIISLSRRYGRPVIVATQMLDSMHRSPRPTRAEATDVANAILDGADACMLSGETAVGKYPIQTVEMMNRIMLATESWTAEAQDWTPDGNATLEARQSIADSIIWPVVAAAARICREIRARVMVVATNSGATALVKSNQRDPTPAIAVSPSQVVLRRLTLCWGIHSLPDAPIGDPGQLRSYIDHWTVAAGWAQPGDRIVFVNGTEIAKSAHSEIAVHEIEAT